MSILEEVLLEEYQRSLKISHLILKEQDLLPKGSIQKKIIKGKPYHYLQFRDGNKIRSQYVKENEIEKVENQIKKRKANDIALKEQKQIRSKIEKAIGKDRIHDFTTA